MSGNELPLGSVQFSANGSAMGTAQTLNSSGTASLSISSLQPGTYTIGAVYTSSEPGVVIGSTATTLNQSVTKAAVVITSMSSLNPSIYGDAVKLTYVFSGAGAAIPTGTATLMDGATQLTTLTLDGSGRATYTSSALAAGSHTLTLTYSGNSNYF